MTAARCRTCATSGHTACTEPPSPLDAPPLAVPPQDLDCEALILSALLCAGTGEAALAQWSMDEIWEALGDLGPEMLYGEANRRILEAIVELDFSADSYLACMPDGVTVEERRFFPTPELVAWRLRKEGRLRQVGGATYLAQLIDCVPAAGPSRLRVAAGIVRECWERREFARKCSAALAIVRCGGSAREAEDLL